MSRTQRDVNGDSPATLVVRWVMAAATAGVVIAGIATIAVATR